MRAQNIPNYFETYRNRILVWKCVTISITQIAYSFREENVKKAPDRGGAGGGILSPIYR